MENEIIICPKCGESHTAWVRTIWNKLWPEDTCPFCKNICETKQSHKQTSLKYKGIDLPVSFANFDISKLNQLVRKFYQLNKEQFDTFENREMQVFNVFSDFLQKKGYHVESYFISRSGYRTDIKPNNLNELLAKLKSISIKRDIKRGALVKKSEIPLQKKQIKKKERETKSHIPINKCGLTKCKHISGELCGSHPVSPRKEGGRIVSCHRFETITGYKFKRRSDALVVFSDTKD